MFFFPHLVVWAASGRILRWNSWKRLFTFRLSRFNRRSWSEAHFLVSCFCMSLSRLEVSHCLTPPSLCPTDPPSCLFSPQWLQLVLATSPLRGFLCSLGCQVNLGMSGSFNTKDGRGSGAGFGPDSLFAKQLIIENKEEQKVPPRRQKWRFPLLGQQRATLGLWQPGQPHSCFYWVSIWFVSVLQSRLVQLTVTRVESLGWGHFYCRASVCIVRFQGRSSASKCYCWNVTHVGWVQLQNRHMINNSLITLYEIHSCTNIYKVLILVVLVTVGCCEIWPEYLAWAESADLDRRVIYLKDTAVGGGQSGADTATLMGQHYKTARCASC